MHSTTEVSVLLSRLVGSCADQQRWPHRYDVWVWPSPYLLMSGAVLFKNDDRFVYLVLEVSAHQIENLEDQRVTHAIEDLTP